jgi:SH3-like domain-containing protein
MRVRLGLATAALAFGSAAQAAGNPPAEPCAITAYLADADPAGLNVRAGASTSSPVLQVIGSEVAGVAELREHRNGWFRVRRIVDAETDATLFGGPGWVHGSLLGLDVAAGDPRLYAGPSRRSRVLATLRPDESRLTLIGCEGGWAKVRVGGGTGWLSPGGQCSNPLTTCA